MGGRLPLESIYLQQATGCTTVQARIEKPPVGLTTRLVVVVHPLQVITLSDVAPDAYRPEKVSFTPADPAVVILEGNIQSSKVGMATGCETVFAYSSDVHIRLSTKSA